MAEPRELLTNDEVADRYRVSRFTLDRWASRRTGPKYLIVGRHRRYRLADLLEWERSREVEPARRPA